MVAWNGVCRITTQVSQRVKGEQESPTTPGLRGSTGLGRESSAAHDVASATSAASVSLVPAGRTLHIRLCVPGISQGELDPLACEA